MINKLKHFKKSLFAFLFRRRVKKIVVQYSADLTQLCKALEEIRMELDELPPINIAIKAKDA